MEKLKQKWQKRSNDAWQKILTEIENLIEAGESQSSIAKRMEVGRAAISNWRGDVLRGERVSFPDMLRYAEALNVDLNTILGMKSSRMQHTASSDLKVLRSGEPVPDVTGAVVPVYQFAAGGLPVEWQEAEPFCEVCIPQKFMFPGLMVLQVVGDSMAPLIKDGAYVGINKHANILTPGKVYAVSVPYEGLTIKRVFLDGDKGELILKPENPIHPTQHVSIDDREGLLVGEVMWGMQGI
ncbi:XRE family transcriptional regulator [Pseudodesulfovibrio nedwellii]|nr:S24 family peptidase [Pseudodesulfovibrio nedwellii]